MQIEIDVLSLFDGMSCGQIALERAGYKVRNYYASEIDKHAIKVTMANYPNTKQLGSVTEVKGFYVDLLIGGSPCQGFSFAGEQLNFEDPRSKLFFEYVRILNECRAINPEVKFLLENVKMKKEYEDIISEALGVKPVQICSSRVSAGMRKRLYWTNIPGISQPEDSSILLQSVLDPGGYTNKEKAYCLLESESRPQKCNWKRFRRWRKKGFVNIVFTDPSLNIFRNRILSQTELEKIQTVPLGYTKILKRDDAAGILGNGWTVDVIAHIFSFASPEKAGIELIK